MNTLKIIKIKSPEECVKDNVLNQEFSDALFGWVGIFPERALEIFEIVKNSGITELEEKSSIKSILDLGINDTLDETEKVFAGYLLAWYEYWDDIDKNVVAEDFDMNKLGKPAIRETKKQGGTLYIKLNDFAKPDTYYAITKIGDSAILLKEVELKIK